jgi:serine protease Do
VQAVEPGSPAAKAGLRAGTTQTSSQLVAGGDLIVGVDGKPVRTPEDIAAAIGDNKPGDPVTIQYFRGHTKRTATVTLTNRPAKAPSSSASPQVP